MAIPKKLRAEIAADPFMRRCIHRVRPTGAECRGRVTWEHAFVYAGRQIQEKWAIVPCCVFHHLGPGLDKGLNRYVALQRASASDLAKYPRTDWEQLKRSLTSQYA